MKIKSISKKFLVPLIAGYIIYLAGRSVMTLVSAQFNKIIFDGLESGHVNELLVKLSINLLLILALTFIISAATALYKGTANRIVQKNKIDILTRIQKMPLEKFQSKHTGQWLTLVEHDAPELYTLLTGTIISGVTPLVVGLSSIIVLLIYSWQIALLSTVLVLLSQLINALFIKRHETNNRHIHESVAASQSAFQDLLSGAITIRIYQFGKHMLDKTRQNVSGIRDAQMTDTKWRRSNNFLGGLLGTFSCMAPIILGLYLVGIHRITLGNAMYCIGLTGNLGWFFGSLSESVHSLTEYTSSYKRLKVTEEPEVSADGTADRSESNGGKSDVYDSTADRLVEKPLKTGDPNKVRPDPEKQDADRKNTVEVKRPNNTEISSKVVIALRDVTVGYGDKVILSRITKQICQGQKVAITGPSGAGKSTLLKSIMHLIPHTGILYRAGEADDAKGLANIVYIPQEMQLITDTILNNLTYWEPSRQEEAVAACKTACIDTFIESLPDGYETMIQKDSGNLSGGQRQRIALARALLRKPDILLMDESTNALDAKTEANVFENIIRQYPDMTVLFITHNPENTRYADVVWKV